MDSEELNIAVANEAFAENKVYMLEKQLKQANERIKQLEELYEGEIGERPELLGSNLLGLLKRELNAAQQRIKRLEEIGSELRDCASRIGTVASSEGSVIRRTKDAIKAWDKEVKL